ASQPRRAHPDPLPQALVDIEQIALHLGSEPRALLRLSGELSIDRMLGRFNRGLNCRSTFVYAREVCGSRRELNSCGVLLLHDLELPLFKLRLPAAESLRFTLQRLRFFAGRASRDKLLIARSPLPNQVHISLNAFDFG